MPFRFLDHTADLRVECRGKTFSDLLESAAQALYRAAFTKTRTEADVDRIVTVEAPRAALFDPWETVLIRWLQELIFLMDVNRFVGVGFVFDRADAETVRARVRGYTYNASERQMEVKAATYHGVKVRREDGEFIAEIIFDL